MNNTKLPGERGQSIVLVAVAMVALILFVAITVDVSSAYYHRRTAQNAADGAALAGVRQLAVQINRREYDDQAIQIEMNDFAERNGIEDTDATLANYLNNNVEGYYLDAKGKRIPNAIVGGGSVPDKAYGIEALTYITSPTYFGAIAGLDGLALQAEAAALLDGACGHSCVVPIATHMSTLLATGSITNSIGLCFNIWNGDGEGNFGWLNWSLQDQPADLECQIAADTCSIPCLEWNLEPNMCRSGPIYVGEDVGGSTGDKNSGLIRNVLKDYVDGTAESDWQPIPFTVVVYEETNGEPGCGGPQGGTWYEVAGFAEMQLIGFQLSQGQSYGDTGIPPEGSDCITLGAEPRGGNRLTARFLQWVTGIGGKCDAIGTARAPALIK